MNPDAPQPPAKPPPAGGTAQRRWRGAIGPGDLQALTQACLCELWGEAKLAAYFRREANEEQGHAAKLICHLLSLGLAPNGTRLKPVRPGRDLNEMLWLDRQFELDAEPGLPAHQCHNQLDALHHAGFQHRQPQPDLDFLR